MTALFGLAYLLFIAAISITSFFVVTRLQKYSINPRFTYPLIVLYIAVTILLILLNVLFFVNIPFDELFYNKIFY